MPNTPITIATVPSALVRARVMRRFVGYGTRRHRRHRAGHEPIVCGESISDVVDLAMRRYRASSLLVDFSGSDTRMWFVRAGEEWHTPWVRL